VIYLARLAELTVMIGDLRRRPEVWQHLPTRQPRRPEDAGGAGSVGLGAPEDGGGSLGEDPDVQRRTPVFDVVEMRTACSRPCPGRTGCQYTI